MKMKRFVLLLVGLMMLVAVPASAASPPPNELARLVPSAVANYYGAINAGDIDEAVAVFAEDATVRSSLTGEEWAGREEIASLLASRARDGREFEMVSYEESGSRAEITVEVSDNGTAWGRETLEVKVMNGMIEELTMTGFRLLF